MRLWYSRHMVWNHKVIKRRNRDGKWIFGIHEVFYDDETGHPFAYTEDPVEPFGDSLKELKQSLEWMRLAIKEKPMSEKQLKRRLKEPKWMQEKTDMLQWRHEPR